MTLIILRTQTNEPIATESTNARPERDEQKFVFTNKSETNTERTIESVILLNRLRARSTTDVRGPVFFLNNNKLQQQYAARQNTTTQQQNKDSKPANNLQELRCDQRYSSRPCLNGVCVRSPLITTSTSTNTECGRRRRRQRGARRVARTSANRRCL